MPEDVDQDFIGHDAAPAGREPGDHAPLFGSDRELPGTVDDLDRSQNPYLHDAGCYDDPPRRVG